MIKNIHIPVIWLLVFICVTNFSCQPDEEKKFRSKLILNKKRAQNGDLLKYRFEIKNAPEEIVPKYYLDGIEISNDSIRLDGLTMGRHRIEGKLFLGDSIVDSKYKTVEITSDISPLDIGYQIVGKYSHNTEAYTQGLVWYNGKLYEGTGQYGESYLAKVNHRNGTYDKKLDLSEDYFGEGVTILDGKLYQLTYISQKCFVYDLETFEKIDEFEYDSQEGWGLTSDGEYLIMSDGSHRLTYINPQTHESIKMVEVYDQKSKLDRLNELEYVNGQVYANIYQSDKIAQIEMPSGRVLGYINLKDILKNEQITKRIDVLNGIAYNPASDHYFVTGKWWPSLFELDLED